MRPFSIAITRCRIVFTIVLLCVAITTVVPWALIRSNNFMISHEFSGSRFPVGSSAISTLGVFTIARAIETRCCSPPDNSLGKTRTLCFKPTRSSTSITRFLISRGFLPITCIAYATFSYTVFLGNNL